MLSWDLTTGGAGQDRNSDNNQRSSCTYLVFSVILLSYYTFIFHVYMCGVHACIIHMCTCIQKAEVDVRITLFLYFIHWGGALNKSQSSPIQPGFYYTSHTQHFCENDLGMVSCSICFKVKVSAGLFVWFVWPTVTAPKLLCSFSLPSYPQPH